MELKTTFLPEKGEKAHLDTILAGPVLPEGMTAPFEHAWGYLSAPGEMEYHKHYKEEVYFFFKGEGFVRIDGEEMPVAPGDVVRIPLDAMHTVINRQNAELLWAAFWWPVQA
ncbi:MAG: cupin domain-containing protein [Clostridia bacterium]|nr:cupin domain-containing protein [Clostridia bacterium]